MANGVPDWASGLDWSDLQSTDIGSFYDPSQYAALGPVDQYQQFLRTTAGYPTGGFARPMEQARLNMFNPLYGQYQAFGFGEGQETFADYLGTAQGPGGAATPSYADLVERASALASLPPAQQALEASARPFFGAQTSGFDPMGAQNRMIQNLALGTMGRSQYNPQVAAAVKGTIDAMYQNYLATPTGGTSGPQGFLKYYMQQRYPGSV